MYLIWFLATQTKRFAARCSPGCAVSSPGKRKQDGRFFCRTVFYIVVFTFRPCRLKLYKMFVPDVSTTCSCSFPQRCQITIADQSRLLVVNILTSASRLTLCWGFKLACRNSKSQNLQNWRHYLILWFPNLNADAADGARTSRDLHKTRRWCHDQQKTDSSLLSLEANCWNLGDKKTRYLKRFHEVVWSRYIRLPSGQKVAVWRGRGEHFILQNPLKLRRSAAVFCWKQKFCRHRGEHLSRLLFSLLHFDPSGWKQLLNVCEGTVYLAHLFPFPIVGFNCLPKKQNHF